jgi:large subunit ribosomal protein L23
MAIISNKSEVDNLTSAQDKADVKKMEAVKTSGNSQIEAGFEHILIEPWVTEKSTNLGMENKYVFKIIKSADKTKVINAIKNIYGVSAISVNIVNIHSKKRVRGKTVGRKPGFKKAVVTLKEGDKIELFKGV